MARREVVDLRFVGYANVAHEGDGHTFRSLSARHDTVEGDDIIVGLATVFLDRAAVLNSRQFDGLLLRNVLRRVKVSGKSELTDPVDHKLDCLWNIDEEVQFMRDQNAREIWARERRK